jgi:hypothetical protein
MPTLDQASRASVATVPMHRGALARSTIISWTLQVATAAALGIDAAVHWQNASAYDAVTATISQGELFRVEAGLAVAVGLLVLVRPQPSSWVAAALVGRGRRKSRQGSPDSRGPQVAFAVAGRGDALVMVVVSVATSAAMSAATS